MRQRLEYALAWPFIKALSLLPRSLARTAAISLAWLVYLLHVRLRQVGRRNLEMAFPEKTRKERARILRGVFTSLGRQLAEVCLYRRYTAATSVSVWSMKASKTTNARSPVVRACCS